MSDDGAIVHVPAEVKGQKGFLLRLTAATALGEGLDGYDLGIISVVLPAIAHELDLGVVMLGLIGASTLIGIFIGSPVIGWLTDRYGRRTLFTIDIISFVILGLLQLFVQAGWQLLVVRLLLGVAIGAEYAIGPAMLAELSPSRGRGERLGVLQTLWYVGFLAAVVIAYALDAAGVPWRVILATSAIPAVITLVLRYGLPESPRWLLSRDRVEEARQIVNKYLGGEKYWTTEQMAGESVAPGKFRELFAPGMRTRTAFASIFWFCNIAPYFAIFTFAPLVFATLQISDERVSTIAANGLAAAGAVAGMLIIDRIGRRPSLIMSFWVTTITLAVVGAWSGAPGIIVVLCFALFSFFDAIGGMLEGVYPAEIFPSHLRAQGTGFAAAFSRIGAASGTFLLPLGIAHLGLGPTMLIFAGISAIGLVVTYLWAPETANINLTKTTSLEPVSPPPATPAAGAVPAPS
jgi:MFS transporter, putative metabolite transport protein